MELDMQKLMALSTDYDPFPILNQMKMPAVSPNAVQPAAPQQAPFAAGIAPGEWDWMKGANIPGQPPQTPGAAPLNPQQMAVLSSMMPKLPDPKFIGGASPGTGGGYRGNFAPIVPGQMTQGANANVAPSLAAILNGRR